MNQDILAGSLGNSQSLNRYSYTQGNPVSYTDPFGLSPLSGMFTGTTFAHCFFGLLGTVPGPVGITANIADAIVYALVDKDYYNAALSGFCAASFGFGSLAKITAGSAKCSKMFKAASSACGMVGNSLEFVDNAQNAMAVGFGMYNKYAIQGESIGWDTVLEAAEFTMAAAGTVGAFGGLMSDTHGLHGSISSKSDKGLLGNIGEVRYRIGEPVNPMEITYEMRLNPKEYAYAVAKKYGINLRGSGQTITIEVDYSLGRGIYGKSGELNPTVILLGKDAFIDEATLANTLAHELSHCRDFIRGAGRLNPDLHKLHGVEDSLNILGGERTVYGAGNALEAYIRGER